VSSQLASNNLYSVLRPEKLDNKLNCSKNTERARDVRRTLRPLREVWIKVGLEKLESHEGVAVRALLDSGATGLFMDMTFAKEKRIQNGEDEETSNGQKRGWNNKCGRSDNAPGRVQYVF